MLKKYTRVWAFLGLVVLVMLLNTFFGWTDTLASPEHLPALRQALQENLAKALLLYIVVAMVGCVVLALPGIVFAIAAGVLFGPVWGTLACLVATTLGASLAFLAGRYFLQDAIKPLVLKNKYIRRFFFEESGKSDLFLLMLTRLLPLFPYNLQNFAYGITDIAFWPYTFYSFVFMLPGTAAYVLAAAGVTSGQNRWLYVGIAAILLVLVGGAALLLKNHGFGKEKPHREAEIEGSNGGILPEE